MKRILIVILFSSFALNAMEKESEIEAENNAISFLRTINQNLDESFDHDNLKNATDAIVANVDKNTLVKVWKSDSPKLHAKTTVSILKTGLMRAVQQKIDYQMVNVINPHGENFEANINQIDQIITDWRSDYNNAKRNAKFIKSFELKNNLK